MIRNEFLLIVLSNNKIEFFFVYFYIIIIIEEEKELEKEITIQREKKRNCDYNRKDLSKGRKEL